MNKQCPLCRRHCDQLEFHHWSYDPEIGVSICRDCHNHIHGGEKGRVSIQENRAEYYGFDGWHDYALMNLIERDIRYLENDVLPIKPLGDRPGWDDVAAGYERLSRKRLRKRKEVAMEWYYEQRRERWSRYKTYLRERYNLPADEQINASDTVWGNNPVQPFDCWLKTGVSPQEARGMTDG
jgi:hypothetical protein